MTHHGGLSLSIIIWRIGGGGGPIFLLPWGPKILLVALQSVGVPWPSNTDILARCPLYSQYVYPSNTDILACYPLYSQ